MKEKLVKYTSITFLIGFFILITVEGLKNCDKPVSHTHSKPKQDYVVEKKSEPYVLRENIIFEVYMGADYEEMD